MKSSTWSFYKALLKNPRQVGAAVPSSKRLAQAIAQFVPITKNSIVVELGPGTGVVTQALLEHGILPQQIVAIENSSGLAIQLQQEFPDIRVLYGSAAHLSQLLGVRHPPICAVVSSLPLLSLPKKTIQIILQQIEMLLPKGGRFIQYTYGYQDIWARLLKDLYPISIKQIWLNIPPARIYVYELTKS